MRNTICIQFITGNFGLNLTIENDIHRKRNCQKVSYGNNNLLMSTYFPEPV